MDPLLTPADASKILAVPIPTIYAWVSRGKIPFVKVGHLLRFERAALAAWLAAASRPARSDQHIWPREGES